MPWVLKEQPCLQSPKSPLVKQRGAASDGALVGNLLLVWYIDGNGDAERPLPSLQCEIHQEGP